MVHTCEIVHTEIAHVPGTEVMYISKTLSTSQILQEAHTTSELKTRN